MAVSLFLISFGLTRSVLLLTLKELELRFYLRELFSFYWQIYVVYVILYIQMDVSGQP